VCSSEDFGLQNTRTNGKVSGRKASETHGDFPHSRGRFSQLWPAGPVLAFTPDVTGQGWEPSLPCAVQAVQRDGLELVHALHWDIQRLQGRATLHSAGALRRPSLRSAHTAGTLIHCPTSNGCTVHRKCTRTMIRPCINPPGSHNMQHGRPRNHGRGTCHFVTGPFGEMTPRKAKHEI
jgi:hypothetical protein